MQSALRKCQSPDTQIYTMYGVDFSPARQSLMHVTILQDTLDSVSHQYLPPGFGQLPATLGPIYPGSRPSDAAPFRSLAVFTRPWTAGGAGSITIQLNYDSMLLKVVGGVGVTLDDIILASGADKVALKGTNAAVRTITGPRRPDASGFLAPAAALTLLKNDSGIGSMFLTGGCTLLRFAGQASLVALDDKRIQIERVDRVEAHGALQFHFAMSADDPPKLVIVGKATSVTANGTQLLASWLTRHSDSLWRLCGWLVVLAAPIITVFWNSRTQKKQLRQRVLFDASLRIRQLHWDLRQPLEQLRLLFSEVDCPDPNELGSSREWNRACDQVKSLHDRVGRGVAALALEAEGHAKILPLTAACTKEAEIAIDRLLLCSVCLPETVERALQPGAGQQATEENVAERLGEWQATARTALTVFNQILSTLSEEVYREIA